LARLGATEHGDQALGFAVLFGDGQGRFFLAGIAIVQVAKDARASCN
jgi:hypothetical protein